MKLMSSNRKRLKVKQFIKFVFKFYESDDVWNATVDYFDGNSLSGTVDIEDVEKNGIEVQFTQA